MARRDVIEVIFWLMVATMICFRSFYLDLGMLSRPGPGFMPFVAGATIGLLAIGLLVHTIKTKQKQGKGRDEQVNFNFYLLALILSLLLAYTIILQLLGYLISTFLLMLFLFSIGGKKRKKWVVVVSAFVAAGISYIVFCIWLQCPFPKGTFTGI
jgi:ABC-type polysaccharide/polyol phosphate export permease